MDAVTRLHDHNMDTDRLLQIDPVVIDETFRLKLPVLPFRKGPAQPRLGNLEQPIEAGEDLVLSVFRRELVQPPFAEAVGAELPANVAKDEFGGTAVGADDAVDIADRLEAALIAHRRQMQAFVE